MHAGEHDEHARGATPGEGTPGGEAPQKPRIDSTRIRELRERLYARGKEPPHLVRHSLAQDVQPSAPLHTPITEDMQQPTASREPVREPLDTTTLITMKRRRYRIPLILFGVAFFVGAVALSIASLFFGNNTISSENISLSVDGPATVSGGSQLAYSVNIINNNAVPIESATLIVEYPRGTRAADNPGRELLSERKQLNRIAPGEQVPIDLKAIIFGEERDEQTIFVKIEYRVQGSNAIFTKELQPSYTYKISTSPVTLEITGDTRMSSGQELALTVTISSNAATDITNLLLRGTYPGSFDYTDSDPDPVSGENTWRVGTLKPAEKKVISIRGIPEGKENDALDFVFDVGVPNERDPLTLASTLMTSTHEIVLENPFLDVALKVNGKSGDAGTVSVRPNETGSVSVEFTNTTDGPIYDAIITAVLSGNALDDRGVQVFDGFYDSGKNTITWDGVSSESLKEIRPGQSSDLSFSVDLRDDVRAPELTMSITVSGRRVAENRVPQTLSGTKNLTIKVESVASLASAAIYSDGPFVNSGPTPPVAEEVTQYTYLLTARSGSNGLADARVTAVMPQYVSWLDLVSDGDAVTYDPTTRRLTWAIGAMEANSRDEAWIQVAFTPSVAQVGTEPQILGVQQFTATDRFTGTTVRTEAPALTTQLRDDPEHSSESGIVAPARN